MPRAKYRVRQEQRALDLAMLKDNAGLITTSGAGSTRFNILHSSHWAVLLQSQISKSSILPSIGNTLLSVFCCVWDVWAKQQEIDEGEIENACL
jgi:hypothetical protein